MIGKPSKWLNSWLLSPDSSLTIKILKGHGASLSE